MAQGLNPFYPLATDKREAMQCAALASRVTGRKHVAYQMRNGRWRWAREGFALLHQRTSPHVMIFGNGRILGTFCGVPLFQRVIQERI